MSEENGDGIHEICLSFSIVHATMNHYEADENIFGAQVNAV